MPHALTGCGGHICRVHEALIKRPGIQIGHHDAGPVHLALIPDRTDHPALLHQQLPDRSVDGDLHPPLLTGSRHGLSDRTHAAHGVSPCTLAAIHLAKDMVQQHIG